MYGFLISVGGILAFLISEKEAKKKGLNLKIFYLATDLAIILGVIGARAWHVIDFWEVYEKNPEWIWQVWKGGLGIFGAIIGGVLGASLVLLAKKENILKWLDILVLGLPLAQSVGRWGNFFNRELYGKETALPWGLYIDGKTYHPLFLYESFLDLILLLVLFCLNKREFPKGTIFFVYLGMYILIRILLQPLRI